MELAVRDVVHGREMRNLDALANPEALEQFRDRLELQSVTDPDIQVFQEHTVDDAVGS